MIRQGQTPEVGNVLMDNQTAILVGGRNCQEKSEQSRYRYQAFSSFQPQTYNWPMVSLYWPRFDGSASILSNHPTNFSNGIPSCMLNSPGTGMTLGEALNHHGISLCLPNRTLLERRVELSLYGKWLRNPRIWGLKVYRWVDVKQFSIPTGIKLWPTMEFTIRNIWSRRSSQRMAGWYEHKGWACPSCDSNHYAKLPGMLFVSWDYLELPDGLDDYNPSLLVLTGSKKTGTTNEDENMWLMLSTPRLTLWLG